MTKATLLLLGAAALLLQARPSLVHRPYGVLLLAHGGTPLWDKQVKDLGQELSKSLEGPVEVAWGMAHRREIQQAIDRLIQKNVQRIVAVPLYVSSHSELYAQTEYVLGIRKDPSATFMERTHAHGGPGGRVQSSVPLTFTSAMDADPRIAEVLSDRARALSRKPEQEIVLLVAHGPVREEDERLWLKQMDILAVGVKTRGGFREVLAATLRDDAPQEVRERAMKHLRKLVRTKSQEGSVLVIPHLIAEGGIEHHIREALEGLFYRWEGRALLPHSQVARWVEQSVREGLQLRDMRRWR